MSVSASTAADLRRDAVLTRLDRGAPDDLPALIADADPVIRHRALCVLRDRLADGRPDGALLPADPSGAPPETVALLARMHLLDPRDAPPPADVAVPASVVGLWAAACIARRGILPDRAPGVLAEAMGSIRWSSLRDPLPALRAASACDATARLAVGELGLLGRTGRQSGFGRSPSYCRLPSARRRQSASRLPPRSASVGVPGIVTGIARRDAGGYFGMVSGSGGWGTRDGTPGRRVAGNQRAGRDSRTARRPVLAP